MADPLLTLIEKLGPEKRQALVEMLRPAPEPIAIVGIGCRFPGGVQDPETFWRFLAEGRDGVVEVPPDRWDSAAYYDPDPAAPGKMYVRHGGFLEAPFDFDANFFGISPREALRMDPQQRLLLQVAWEALEHAGLAQDRLPGPETGVFLGVVDNLYKQRQLQAGAQGIVDDPYFLIGSACSAAAGRLSYLLNLQGPNVALDTACSSSLVAVHLACQSLRSRECSVALAGGVHVLTVPEVLVTMCKMNMLSHKGRCRTFDAQADGFVFGEGCGVVVLKRLSDALAQRDQVLAVIRGSAVNEDGQSTSLTAPNGQAQQAVIRQALAAAGVAPGLVGYVEAHGSATALGDPIEIEALGETLLAGRETGQRLYVGSVKSNIGHLAAGAGIAGLIKTALALRHRAIPPSLHFDVPNPNIAWQPEQLAVPTALTPWEPIASRRLAGVSSFGWAGTNAHVVLEEAPEAPPAPSSAPRPYELLALSARTEAALEAAALRLAQHLRAHPELPLASVAYTLQEGRKAFEQRGFVVCQGTAQAASHLATALRAAPAGARRIQAAFMFAGLGDQYVHMARELYEHEPHFRAVVDTCCALLEPLLGRDLRDILYPARQPAPAAGAGLDLRQMLRRGQNGATSELHQAEIAQPALFVVEYALAQLLQSWGLTPTAMIGYSLGEYVAACVAGVLSLEDALKLVAGRAQLIQRLPPGSMLAIPLAAEELRPLLSDEVALGVVNGPRATVLSGASEVIAQLDARLRAEGILCQRVETSHAFHSPLMRPIADQLTALAATLRLQPPRIPYLSNVSGTWITAEQATDPGYWARHLCQTVLFDAGLETLLAGQKHLLVEIGPGQALSSFARQHPRCTREQLPLVVPTLPASYDRQHAQAYLLEAVGKIWQAGGPCDWARMHPGRQRQPLELPTYPFEARRFWIEAAQLGSAAKEPGAGKRPNIANWFYAPAWEPAPLAPDSARPGGTWLLLEDRLGVGAQLARQLQARGVSTIRVAWGERLELGGERWQVRIDEPGDYQALFDHLYQSGQVPDQIVHMWSLSDPTRHWDGRPAFEAAQKRGFYSVLFMAKALGAQRKSRPLRIVVLSNGMHPVAEGPLYPEKATLAGLCLVLPQEYRHLQCRLVDVALHEAAEEPLIHQLVEELATPGSATQVAYRGALRYVRTQRPHPLPERAQASPLRERGVYLITGGLGGIGLELADYLAREARARLVLTSRSGMPPRERWEELLREQPEAAVSRRIRQVRALEARGAEVLVLAADVSDEAQMAAALEAVDARFGGLNGVIHGAGVVDWTFFKSVQELDVATCEAHFTPKAYGLYVLEKVLQGRELDFHVLLSSLSTVLGGISFAAYAAANSFLDAYVHTRAHPQVWMSVDWDVWQVASTQGAAGALGTTLAEFEMTAEEGVQAFARALASGVPHLINSTGDLAERLRRWVQPQAALAEQHGPAHERPPLRTAFVGATNESERAIAAIWREALGLETVGIHDNFFDLGGNSLIALQVVDRLQKTLGVQISTMALFEAPTISALSGLLAPGDDQAPRGDEEELLAQRRRSARRGAGDSAVAIVGWSGRFPGAGTVDALWANLCAGVESITFFTPEELIEAGVPAERVEAPGYVRARPILEDVGAFDAAFFGYNPREAELLDPQIRIFLECAWEALETAGYAPSRYKGMIGVFAGASLSTYLLSWYRDPRLAESVNDYQLAMAGDKDSLTTTVSYRLNLRGPSFAVQTFCSTSLVATHVAVQSLLGGECDIALAGGVSLRVPTKAGYVYQPGGMESPDGHCRSFDAQARGTLFGDGAGIVVLKRLDDALADGDTIYAVLKGSAINNDGAFKVGYTAPSVAGQSEAILLALEHAQVDPETIRFVEAHGSATELGDPIEVTALTRAFRRHTDRRGFCAIGSVKTNVGHLERAAGVAGLLKAALAIHHGVIPPTLHFETPNPEIDFASSPFYVNSSTIPWPVDGDSPRRAAVNSLGMGGTNAHVILEQAPPAAPSGPSRPWQLLCLSAKTKPALDTLTANLASHLREHPELALADVAYTLQLGRETFAHRRVLVCDAGADALAALESADPRRLISHHQPARTPAITFMFPGVGDHYLHMARDLYEREPFFCDVVEQCDRQLHAYLGAHVRDLLYPERAEADDQQGGLNLRAMLQREGRARSQAALRLEETALAQPLVFVIEYALAQLLQRWGLRPAALIGYSVGEYVAACVAGVLSLEDALKLVALRAQLIQALPAGGMLAVSVPAEELPALLSPAISLATHNGASTYVLAGPPEEIAQLQRQLEARGISCRPVKTTHAFHSTMMEPLVEPLTSLVRTVKLNPPRIPYISNVTGTWITPEQALDPSYWAQHMCGTVRFFDGLTELLAERDRLLVEVGPGQSLCSFVKQHPACSDEQGLATIPLLRYEYVRQNDQLFLLNALGRLWLLGVEPDWAAFYGGEARRRLPLPTYPFERQRYWIDVDPAALPAPATATPTRPGTVAEQMLALPRLPMEHWFSIPAWTQEAPRPPRLEPGRAGRWLLFADEVGLSDELGGRLTALGAQVLLARPGESFARIDAGSYVIRPRAQEDYARLLDQLGGDPAERLNIAHLWSVGPACAQPEGEREVQQALDLGFNSLICLAQALGARQRPAALTIVASQLQAVTGHETIAPLRGTLTGPYRMIPLEYPDMTCQLVDVELQPAAGRLWELQLANLLGEIAAAEPAPAPVALRRGQRWTQTFQPLPDVATCASAELRQQGVYLITGGLGGLGLAIAEQLARACQARLALLGRTPLPPRSDWEAILARGESKEARRIRQVVELERQGAEVLVLAADIADAGQVERAVASTVERFGALHGVVHAAGLPGGGLIQLKSLEVAEAVLAPKLLGTLALERALRQHTLDFCVLFSSIAAITGGGPGQVDYCAANAFLDAFAQSRVAHPTPTISINWSEWEWNAWEEGLAGYADDVQAFFRTNRARFGLRFSEGQQAFALLLGQPVPQAIVATQDLRRVSELSRSFTVRTVREFGGQEQSGGKRYPRPTLGGAYVAPRNDVEQRIAAVWADILRLETVGVEDNFFDLGGNSLIGLDLVARLQQALQTPIPPHLLYEAPSVAAVARYLARDDQPQADLADHADRGARRRQAFEQRRPRARRLED